jgi:hypothetical protein
MSNIYPLSPTQELIFEVLTARYRLGETSWTFSAKLSKQLALLEVNTGYINWKHASIEHCVLVWFTEKGKKEFLSKPYTPSKPSEW